MPLKKCSNNGSPGYKWGDSGKCYTGPGARDKALKQGRAIEVNKNKGSLLERMKEYFSDAKFEYEDPKTGEVYLFTRRGGHKKDGRLLLYRGKSKDEEA